MKEKLIIKNFGPIKDIELGLGRFNILIGEQATGKSTVAKVLAVCRTFSYLVGGVIDHPRVDTFHSGLKALGILEYVKDSYIFYECKDYSLTYNYWLDIPYTGYNEGDDKATEYTKDESELNIVPLSQEFKILSAELEKINIKENRIPISFYQEYISKILANPIYLPTERGLQSVFSLGQASIPNVPNFLYSYFADVDDILRNYGTEVEIEPLDIKYINRNGVGFSKKSSDDEFHLLSNSASGYQSTIPIVLIMRYYNELLLKNRFFIIEEPELNLFPKAQDKLMQYLVDKTMSYGNSVLLTTHSPYILTSLNNMMYAHQTGKIDEEKTAEIIDKKYWINPEEVSAYMMKTDGTVENIIDAETMQIIGERIDEVSTGFNKDYDAMLDIKYAKQ